MVRTYVHMCSTTVGVRVGFVENTITTQEANGTVEVELVVVGQFSIPFEVNIHPRNKSALSKCHMSILNKHNIHSTVVVVQYATM